MFGVKTAEAIWQAKSKCPNLIILPADYSKYMEYSKKAKEIYLKYTDMVEPFGIDECWLDVTGSTLLFGDGEKIANLIREEIKEKLKITISVGVSFNKVFAKLGSDMKKPDAVTVLSRENFKEKIYGRKIEELLFVGNSTKTVLNRNGIFTIGEVAELNEKIISRLLGKNGLTLLKCARGEDTEPVKHISYSRKPKSIGKSVTCSRDFKGEKDVWEVLLILSEKVSESLVRENMYAGGVQLHIRDANLKTREISRTLNYPTFLASEIAKNAIELFNNNCDPDEAYRSLGVRAVNLREDVIAVQEDIFSSVDSSNKEEAIEKSVYALREKYGKNVIKRGTVLKIEDI